MSRRRKQASPKKRSQSRQQTADGSRLALKQERAERKQALERERATSEILRVIAESQTDAQPVFDTIVRNAVTLCGGMDATAFRYDGEQLHLVATTTRSVELRKILAHMYPRRPDERQAAGRAILAKGTIKIEDARADPAYDHGVAIAGSYRRVLAVPMLRGGEPIGVINVAWAKPGPISKRQEQLLQTFADQAVIAVENVRLFNETKEALEQQTASSGVLEVISKSPSDLSPVFDAILASATRLCGAHLGVLNLWDGENYRTVCQQGGKPEFVKWLLGLGPFKPDPVTSLARVIEEREPIQILDLKEAASVRAGVPRSLKLVELGGVRTHLAVPLVKDERVLGAIAIYRSEVRAFSTKQIELVKTFAKQAVIAIENARLFNETKEALDQQKASADVLGVISRSPSDLTPVFDAILTSALQLCEAHLGHLHLYDGEIYRTVAQRGATAEFAKYISERGPYKSQGGVAWATAERRPVHEPDLKMSPAYLAGAPNTVKFVELGGARTALNVPLLKDDKVLGVLVIYRPEVRPFTEKQIALVSLFANQAVIAMENTRLFNETKEALDQQKAMAEVLAVISSSIADTTPVFDKILESCQRVFSGRNVGIGVVGDDARVHIGAYKGHGRAELEAHFPVPLSMESGAGAAILQRRVVHYPDSEAPDVPEYARRGGRIAGNKSVLFAPMLWEGKGVGAIFVGRSVTGLFSDKEIALLRTFADQAAIAIQNAKLFREIQEKSAQLEVANKHKSDFLANMSHELRTPLNAIIGFSEAMIERMFGDLNDKQLEYQKDILESGKHLLSLINDILDLSKIEAGRMELELSTFHLPTAVSNAVILIRERAMRHGIALGVDIDERLGEFQADERKVKQILLNLLSNAVKFTPDGGRVDVSAKLDTDKVEIAVKDTGVGIAPEDQASLFEEFKQLGKDSSRKAEGTGLGLALTKRLVELHGGQILVESAVGHGSTFRIMLPLPHDRVIE